MQLFNALPRRVYLVTLLALTGITLLSWYYLVYMAAHMPMMQIQKWDLHYFGMMYLMWAIMMIAMMIPSATPMIMIYVAIAKKAAKQEQELVSTTTFICGYIFIWLVFSLFATTIQWGLNYTVLITPMMKINNESFGAALFIIAGIYQLLPIKKACLNQCRSPVHFISKQWRSGVYGAFRMGLSHGLFCLGCCWLIMCLLFVGGVMNLLWVAIISLLVLLEKVLILGEKFGRMIGYLMILIGGTVLLT